MDVIEARQLVPLDAAMKLANLSPRTFHRRLKQNNVAIFINPLDRRKRLVDASDVRKFARPVEPAREYDGSGS